MIRSAAKRYHVPQALDNSKEREKRHIMVDFSAIQLHTDYSFALI